VNSTKSTSYRLAAAALTVRRGGPIWGVQMQIWVGQMLVWVGQRHVENERRVVGLVIDITGRRVGEGGDAVGRGPVALVNVAEDMQRRPYPARDRIQQLEAACSY